MSADLHVHRYGPATGIRLLAIHGLTGHGKRWESLATGHLPDVAVAAPDLVGHGRSSWSAPWTIEENVAALAALVSAESDGPVLVVGHSFGGGVALNLAAERPDLVAGLVLLDPAIGLDGMRMREIADDMLTSPDYTDREEARAEKATGSWADVNPAVLDAELDEHLVPWPGGRVGWRLSLAAMISYWSELARPVVVPRSGTGTTLVRATHTDPPYVSDTLIEALDVSLGPDFTRIDFDCNHMVPLALPAETAAVIRERLA
ncbi:MAG: alpha/beta fold hydrolase [Mycolicibacterium sp.]|nr:alpha/beta fold hydrolase [Mycolicibacterium sp.]